MSFLTPKIGIDLGTTYTLVFVPGRGVVLNEPSVVAVSEDNTILAVGIEAKQMIGRTPESIVAYRPMRDGVIADYRMTEAMLRYYIRKALGPWNMLKPEVMVSVPAGVTSTEKRAVIEATCNYFWMYQHIESADEVLLMEVGWPSGGTGSEAEQQAKEEGIANLRELLEFGKIKGLLKAVRGPHAESGHQLQLFTNNRIVFYERKRGSIFTVSQCDLKDFFYPIRGDFKKTVFATYFLELVDLFTEAGGDGHGIFTLLYDSLKALEGIASPRRLSRILEIRLLSLSGLMPGFKSCASCGEELPAGRDNGEKIPFDVASGGTVCEKCRRSTPMIKGLLPGTSQFIQHVQRCDYDKAVRVKVSDAVGRELESVMREFVDYHVGRPIRSVEFMKKTGF